MIIFKNREYARQLYTEKMNRIIGQLKKRKLSLVGILCERKPELLYLLESLYDNEIAFVPIDTSCPLERIQYILQKAGVEMVIADKKYANLLPNQQIIYMDEIGGEENFELCNLDEKTNKNELAYILFTSGSTGKPKGVEITREALANFFVGMEKSIDFSCGNRIACLTTVSFDIFFVESLFALKRGLTIVLANETEQMNPRAIVSLLENNKVDIIQLTPSRLQMMVNYQAELSCFNNMKIIMIGGEVLPLHLLQLLQQKKGAMIYNMYGPTETTIWSSISDLTQKDMVDIGKAMHNTYIYILNENQLVAEANVSGEICIAGKGLARGYVNDFELTNEKFIYVPEVTEDRLYRTGDIGCFLTNGCIRYIGRKDNQVKIHGYRIELEEIEACALRFPGISGAIAYYDFAEASSLCLYYTGEGILNSEEIRKFLLETLPSYMVPVVYIQIKDFLYTLNGKVDRNRMKECIVLETLQQKSSFESESEDDEVFCTVRQIVAAALSERANIEIDKDTNLETLGIDSLTFIRLIVSIEEEFQFMFDENKLVMSEFPTVAALGEYVLEKTRGLQIC